MVRRSGYGIPVAKGEPSDRELPCDRDGDINGGF